MGKIIDTGKVWLEGERSPIFALLIGEQVFVPGGAEEEDVECWVDGGFLCVDQHDPAKKARIARSFALDLPPITPGILYSGFAKTKHAETRVVNYRDEGVGEFVVDSKKYKKEGVGELDRLAFWKITGLPSGKKA